MIGIDAFSELLSALYSSPLQQEQWQQFLMLVCKHTQSINGYFLSADTSSGAAAMAAGGRQEVQTAVSQYNTKHVESDPLRSAIIRMRRTGVFTENELLPQDGLLATQMYRELLVHINHRYAAVALINLSIRRMDGITIWRSEDEGPMEPDSRRLLELLLPHIRIALEISRRLGITRQQLADARTMADAAATATFLVTQRGVVEHCNAAAESLLREADGITLINGKLVAAGSARGALSRLLLDAASPSFPLSPGQPNRALSLQRPSGKPSLQLLASPLPPAHRSTSNADMLLLVSDPARPIQFPDDTLRALYKLTPAETEVANGLLMGYSAQEIALLRHVSVGTTRQQLHSMMGKTGTARQSDMVRLLMALPRTPSPEN
jgi:DNA-binding CsgD family transcriptional regulator